MKKVLFSLFAIVALFVVSSCSSSETMNKLNGTWETTSTFEGVPVDMTWEFDSPNKTTTLRMVVKVEGIETTIIEVKAPFTASSDYLKIDFDKGDISVRIADEAISAFDLSTTDVVSTIQEVKNGLKDEYKGVGLEKIKSLTDNELVVDEEGTVFTLHRVK